MEKDLDKSAKQLQQSIINAALETDLEELPIILELRDLLQNIEDYFKSKEEGKLFP